MSAHHTAEVISIGDELLIGQVINSNQADIARDLNSIGISIRYMTTVGDTEQEILDAFAVAAQRSEVVLVTGGLGPTHDDVTRAAVCTFLGCEPVLHVPTLDHIREMFSRRGLALTPLNEDQARIPAAVEVVPNRLGTAAGYTFRRDTATFFVMPGVPYEMQAMMKETVAPLLASRRTGRVLLHRTIKTTGIAESHLAEKLGPTDDLLMHQQGLSLAYLPGPHGVRLRLTGTGTDAASVQTSIARAEQNILGRAGVYVYGYDDDDLETVVGRVLTERGLTIAVAESCTGGLILDRITNVPGSSAYLERGFICYSDRSKTELLGVPAGTIAAHGAVSGEVARSMAEGARLRSSTDIGLSTTGIAGPAGGSDEKPVGLVYIGYADAKTTLHMRFVFGNDRRRIKERASQAALDLLRRKLLG